jgi:hypothetical protein
LEELTRYNSRYNSRKSSKFKKTRNPLNETYLSVVCRQSKSTSTDTRDKNAKEESEKEDTYSGFTSSSNSSFPYCLNHDNQSEDFMAPSRFIENESNACHPIDINVKTSKENSLIKNGTGKIVDNDIKSLGTFKQFIKYPEVEDIDIFQEQHLKIRSSLRNRHRNSRHNRHHSRTHKAPTTSSNSTECYIKESHDKLKIRSDEIQNDVTNTINEIPHCTVLRSSTLPSFQTVTKNKEMRFSDTEAKAMDLSVQCLRHAPFLKTSYDILNHEKLTGEEYNNRLSKQFSERVTHKRCIDPNVLSSNTIFKPESYVKDITSLTEQEQNVSDINETPTSIGHRSAKNIPNNVPNVPHGVQSPLDKETSLLVKQDKIHHETDTILCLEKEIVDEGSNNYNRSGEEKKNKPLEQHNSFVPENDTLQLENVAIVTLGECDIHTTTHVCCETTVIEEESPEYVANTTVYNFAVSMPYCNSRTKSCTDLTLPAHVSVRQNGKLYTSPVYSSSPRLTTCDLTL